MGKGNIAGKSHTYPSNRQSYSTSRKGIGGRKKNVSVLQKQTNSTASFFDRWKKPSTIIDKKFIHIVFFIRTFTRF